MTPKLFSHRNKMASTLLDCFGCSLLWVASEWIISYAFKLCRNHTATHTDLANMRLLPFREKLLEDELGVKGDNSRCVRSESEKLRQKIQKCIRNRIYTSTVIVPLMARHSSKEKTLFRISPKDMTQPLITTEDISLQAAKSAGSNMVVLEAGLPGDTWRYCVDREQLAEKSELFRAMLIGPLAPAPSDPPPLLQLQHVEKRAFDYLFRYLLGEPINFQSVVTARATLDAAHQYLCPELVHLAVEYLERNLNPSTVLEIYQGLSLYASPIPSNVSRSFDVPTAPPAPGDDAGEIAEVCTRLLLACLDEIDSHPRVVFSQEYFEELNAKEVEQLACRDTLKLKNESILFYALERWAASECRRHGVEPSASNKRSVLSDKVWYSVRYPLMTDKEFIEGPMASGILSSEESAAIVARILGHTQSQDGEELRSPVAGPLSRLSSAPRIIANTHENRGCTMSKSGKKERQDNRNNWRKECATQGQRTCVRIGTYILRVLACIFD
ncbi:BTB/POZ domain-containing protein axundead isoform X2 [Lasioglossum baleicum]|uniref:BTB/POZ domain-containing protein axundead isoform X2 n=1 Tax=Lasioglossum baleicum TaxID=434251 RepID=UPI003FCDAA53